MKIQTICLLLALIVLSPAASNAQLGNFLRNQAAKALKDAAPKEKPKDTTSKIDTSAQKKTTPETDDAKEKRNRAPA